MRTRETVAARTTSWNRPPFRSPVTTITTTLFAPGARLAPERPDAEGAPRTPLGWRRRVWGARTVDIVSGGMIGARGGGGLYSVGCRCEGREMCSVCGCDVVCGV